MCVRFPDAPTVRGIKHVEELIHCIEEGYEAYLLLVIQMKGVKKFMPNWDTQPEFGEALIKAEKAGVKILARDCLVNRQPSANAGGSSCENMTRTEVC